VKERMMCEEFDKLIKEIKITVHRISTLNSLMKHKIIICLSEKFITKNEK